MFGYRLTREKDYDALVQQLQTLQQSIVSQHNVVLEARVAAATHEAAAKTAKTTADHLMVELNTARFELATLRQHLTGLPQVAPQIVQGPARMSETLGAGAAIFDDIGDQETRRLQEQGIELHASDAEVGVLDDGLTPAKV